MKEIGRRQKREVPECDNKNSKPPSHSIHGRQGFGISTPKVGPITPLGPLRMLNISQIVNVEHLSNNRNLLNMKVIIPVSSRSVRPARSKTSITNSEVTVVAEQETTQSGSNIEYIEGPSLSSMNKSFQSTPLSRFGKTTVSCRRKLVFEDTTVEVKQPVFSDDEEPEEAGIAEAKDDNSEPHSTENSESELIDENSSSNCSIDEAEMCELEELDDLGFSTDEPAEQQDVIHSQSTRNCERSGGDEVGEDTQDPPQMDSSESEEMNENVSISYSRVEDENCEELDEFTHSMIGVVRNVPVERKVVEEKVGQSTTRRTSDVELAAASSPTSSSVVLEDDIDDVDESTDGNGPNANSPRRNGRKGVFGLMLKKRTIIKPGENPNNLRRSRRSRCEPLRSWLGEKAIYVDSPSGGGKRLIDVTSVLITDKKYIKYETADPILAKEREMQEKCKKSRKSKRPAKK